MEWHAESHLIYLHVSCNANNRKTDKLINYTDAMPD